MALKLYRPKEPPDHFVGEDRTGALLLFPARPSGWNARTPFTGAKRMLVEVPAAEGRRTRWPGAIGGAPRANVASTHQIGVRVTDDERNAWEELADGISLSEWIRDTCNAAVSVARSRGKGKP